jgi:hypothetical protein
MNVPINSTINLFWFELSLSATDSNVDSFDIIIY